MRVRRNEVQREKIRKLEKKQKSFLMETKTTNRAAKDKIIITIKIKIIKFECKNVIELKIRFVKYAIIFFF